MLPWTDPRELCVVEAVLFKGYGGTRGGQKGDRDVRIMGQMRNEHCPVFSLPGGFAVNVEKVKGK